jgi:hypothetical protein
VSRTRDNVTGFTVVTRDTDTPIHRDVLHDHPDYVHRLLGTGNEAELQAMLDQVSYDEFFDDGVYNGPNASGLGLSFGD